MDGIPLRQRRGSSEKILIANMSRSQISHDNGSPLKADFYFCEIALPTLDEFLRDNSNVRLAFLSSISVIHTLDYIYENREVSYEVAKEKREKYVREQRRKDLHFDIVYDFANASKHCKLRTDKGISSGSYRSQIPAIAGIMECGNSSLGDSIGGIFVDRRELSINLSYSLKHIMYIFISFFDELSDVNCYFLKKIMLADGSFF